MPIQERENSLYEVVQPITKKEFLDWLSSDELPEDMNISMDGFLCHFSSKAERLSCLADCKTEHEAITPTLLESFRGLRQEMGDDEFREYIRQEIANAMDKHKRPERDMPSVKGSRATEGTGWTITDWGYPCLGLRKLEVHCLCPPDKWKLWCLRLWRFSFCIAFPQTPSRLKNKKPNR